MAEKWLEQVNNTYNVTSPQWDTIVLKTGYDILCFLQS